MLGDISMTSCLPSESICRAGRRSMLRRENSVMVTFIS